MGPRVGRRRVRDCGGDSNAVEGIYRCCACGWSDDGGRAVDRRVATVSGGLYACTCGEGRGGRVLD